jgi:hypothetical protein
MDSKTKLILVCNEVFSFLEKPQYGKLKISIRRNSRTVELYRNTGKGSGMREIRLAYRTYFISSDYDDSIPEIVVSLLNKKKEVLYRKIAVKGSITILLP